jgi:hypothetical protein
MHTRKASFPLITRFSVPIKNLNFFHTDSLFMPSIFYTPRHENVLKKGKKRTERKTNAPSKYPM